MIPIVELSIVLELILLYWDVPPITIPLITPWHELPTILEYKISDVLIQYAGTPSPIIELPIIWLSSNLAIELPDKFIYDFINVLLLIIIPLEESVSLTWTATLNTPAVVVPMAGNTLFPVIIEVLFGDTSAPK